MPQAGNPDYSQFAINPFGQVSQKIDYSSEYAPYSKTYHGITIAVDGNVVGRIQSWDTGGAWARGGEHVYELMDRTWGKPVDYVPGRWEGLSITASVAEMWDAEIEIQLGLSQDSQLNDLIEQTRPFTTHEFWFRSDRTYRIWVYKGCWLTDRNETAYAADGNARVIANFNFNYVARQILA
jgi:hypothetical protein